MRVSDSDIAIVIPIVKANVDKMLASIKRTFKKKVTLYLFSELTIFNDILKLRTICNSLQSEDFIIKLIEHPLRVNTHEDVKYFDEKFIILIEKNIFFIKENWYQEMYDYIVNYGQTNYSFDGYVTMFKKDWWDGDYFLDKITTIKSGKLIYTIVE
jgi:hypothetical protein